MAGSLIKNPGGGIAPTGGYIAGKKELVEMCAYRLTTPGTGKEIGATLNANRELFMGAYHAPHVTGEALKTAVFASALLKFSVMKQVLSTMMQEEISFSLSCSVMQKRYAVFARVFRAVRLLTALYLRFRRICRVTKVR